MGIHTAFFSLLRHAQPFESEPLDSLAKAMGITEILENGRLQRYYCAGFVPECSAAYFDGVFFDATFLGMLLPDELLAIGAHEFTHVKGHHGVKRFCRVFMPATAAAALAGLTVFSQLRTPLLSLLIAALSFFPALISFLYLNAGWNRQIETECDLSAVKYADGEAMVSALIKANGLRPVNTRSLAYRFGPKLYPSIDQRINHIRKAMQNKKNPQQQAA